MTTRYLPRMQTWMRKRGDRVTITTGKYAGHSGTVDSNVFQRTADYPGELSEGFHVMLDSGELVTVRWDQVERLTDGSQLMGRETGE